MKCPKCNHEIKSRTKPQNDSYWKLCVEPLVDFLEGYTKEEIHELLKYKFLSEVRYVKNRIKGNLEEVKVMKSTTSLTTIQFNEFMSQIRIWASQLGCSLKEPNEVDYANN